MNLEVGEKLTGKGLFFNGLLYSAARSLLSIMLVPRIKVSRVHTRSIIPARCQ